MQCIGSGFNPRANQPKSLPLVRITRLDCKETPPDGRHQRNVATKCAALLQHYLDLSCAINPCRGSNQVITEVVQQLLAFWIVRNPLPARLREEPTGRRGCQVNSWRDKPAGVSSHRQVDPDGTCRRLQHRPRKRKWFFFRRSVSIVNYSGRFRERRARSATR